MKRGPQPNLVVYSQISLDKELIDMRANRRGFFFGTVRQICQQFGIKYKRVGQYTAFYAPKTRLQKFVEKLHFSGNKYTER